MPNFRSYQETGSNEKVFKADQTVKYISSITLSDETTNTKNPV